MLFDALFVARAQYKPSTGFNSDARLLASHRTAAASGAAPTANGGTEHSIRASLLARRSSALASELDRLALAARLVQSATGAAKAIATSLTKAKSLVQTIEATVKLQSQAPVSAVSITGSTIALSPVSLTGGALSADPVTVTGTATLTDDTPAGSFGDLVLSPVSDTGTVSLVSDAVASVTGTNDVASVSNFVLETSISQSETLTIDAGNGVQTIVFGLLQGQVNDAAELEAAIDAIDGVEASYTVDGFLSIVGENADVTFTLGGTADLQTVFGIAEQTYDPTNLLSQGINAGETLTFKVGTQAVETITFGSAVNEVSTLAELNTALGGLTGLTASVDGSNRVTFVADTSSDAVTVGGTVDAPTVFGLAQTTHDPNDLLIQGISQGETLTFQIDGEAVQTITFGTGLGEVNTVSELNGALATLSGITASIDGQNRLTFAADDATHGLTVGGTADISGVLGITPQTYDPFNLLDQGVSQGQSLTVQVGSEPVQTIIFGTGGGEVATLSALGASLSALSGVTALVDGQNRLVFTAVSAEDSLTLGGTADLATAFGITEQTYIPDDLLDQGLAQGETLTIQVDDEAVQTITFGTGPEEVSTLSGLNAALGALSGLTASLDAQNRISITGPDTTSVITIGGTADVETVFGIAERSYDPSDLLDKGIVSGQTLTLQLNGGSAQTITFGYGANEVATLAELDAALGALVGLSAEVDSNNRVVITAGQSTDTIVVGGTANVQGVLGVSVGTFTPAYGTSSFGAATVEALRADFNGELARIGEHLADARVEGNANLVDGVVHRVRLSDRPGDEAAVGGIRLSLKDLGLLLADETTFSSEQSTADVLKQIDQAIVAVDQALDRLEAHADLLATRTGFSDRVVSIVGDAVDGLTVEKLDLDAARSAAIDARKSLARQVISDGLTGGAVSRLGRSDELVFTQLVQTAFGGTRGRLFAPIQFTI